MLSVHGGWSLWTSFTECSVTCGSGTQTRERECNNPVPDHGGLECGGVGYDSISCDLEVCNSEYIRFMQRGVG